MMFLAGTEPVSSNAHPNVLVAALVVPPTTHNHRDTRSGYRQDATTITTAPSFPFLQAIESQGMHAISATSTRTRARTRASASTPATSFKSNSRLADQTTTALRSSSGDEDEDGRANTINNGDAHPPSTNTNTDTSNRTTNNNAPLALSFRLITDDPKRSILFSVLMTACGAGLGPFLDSYHSAFGVLVYNEPIRFTLWGSEAYPALTTAWWVPELFGLAGFLIGWLYVLLDAALLSGNALPAPSPPKILAGVSFFTLQYWLSGILVQADVLDRTGILDLMSVICALGFLLLDGTVSGLAVSFATCVGGPLIEAGLIAATNSGALGGGYHYTDPGETGFFPLWIVPVYFLGGPANGNLARGFWNALAVDDDDHDHDHKHERGAADTEADRQRQKRSCTTCRGTRRTPCPNCDGIGTYVAMGNRTVRCTSCNGRGYVVCRSCFHLYDDDPYDIDGIRETMNRMPD
mmetsp:Transcript_6386/g.12777  ORF Transcript_6386/g.12777 Transcript_6386/m.12777 type:complete len:464 (+) Transcript_6386:24-1415(+)